MTSEPPASLDVAELIENCPRIPEHTGEQDYWDWKRLSTPVIVTAEGALVDGLRRLYAAARRGDSNIDAYVTHSFEESVARLKEQHVDVGADVTFKRVWEIQLALGQQARARGRNNPGQGQRPVARKLLADAFGSNEGVIAVSSFLYRVFSESVDPEVLAIRDKLEAGNLGLYEARAAMSRIGKTGLDGDISTAPAQREALTTAMAHLSGTMLGLGRMGEIANTLSTAEITMYLQGFKQSRSALQRFIRELEKRI